MDHIHTFLTAQGHGGPARMSDQSQCRGHLRDSTNMKDNTHQAHTVVQTRGIWNDDYDSQVIFGDLGGPKVA